MRSPNSGKVLVWDLPTRLFKWLLVLLVAMAWVSNKFGTATPVWHKWNGYAILTLVVFRILWGFAGGSTARFSSFVRSPFVALGYARDLVRGRVPRYLGHNPLGAFMILALLGGLAAQGVLGLYSGDSDRLIIEGPLAKTVSDALVTRLSHWHAMGFNILLGLIAIHVLAVMAYRVLKKDPLVEGMVTGRKPADRYADAGEATPGSPLAALACVFVAAAVVFGGIMALGGNPFR